MMNILYIGPKYSLFGYTIIMVHIVYSVATENVTQFIDTQLF